MDFLNSYGVHPFWPVENAWFYGDSVFIVEPLYWAAAAPLVFVLRSKVARVVIALALLAGLILGFVSSLVPVIPRVGFMALTLVLLVIGSRTSARTAAIASAVAMLVVTAAFITGGQLAARRIGTIAATDFPADRLIDHVLTPGPMNPLCWDVLLLETHGDRYTVRHGVLSNAPVSMPASRCPTVFGNQSTTVPLRRVSAPESAGMHWFGEFEMSKTDLAQIVAGNCNAAALMQFARAPFVAELERRWVIGDLRFERGRGGGMADIDIGPDSPGPCPKSAPWTPPRAELLQ
jgi:inner membrane protein